MRWKHIGRGNAGHPVVGVDGQRAGAASCETRGGAFGSSKLHRRRAGKVGKGERAGRGTNEASAKARRRCARLLLNVLQGNEVRWSEAFYRLP